MKFISSLFALAPLASLAAAAGKDGSIELFKDLACKDEVGTIKMDKSKQCTKLGEPIKSFKDPGNLPKNCCGSFFEDDNCTKFIGNVLARNEYEHWRDEKSLLRGGSYALYAHWAATYNHDDVKNYNYAAPVIVAQIVLASASLFKGPILDACCGTGLVGEVLAQDGATTIDGIDLSPDILKVAGQTGVYRNFEIGDLGENIAKPDGTYDIVARLCRDLHARSIQVLTMDLHVKRKGRDQANMIVLRNNK
ncbi:Uu.00g000120.m01.CDS01 [Anthostomella pinea]|uniref:Uu.00g000120.m01.CDS01 n=1 Tax=Anthostomella pinea TaxID=933095 RepID=A0AAI8YII7_9PEZI|nr:Uu.00g000120.m01.CDS01 [Anthostomella pinea]